MKIERSRNIWLNFTEEEEADAMKKIYKTRHRRHSRFMNNVRTNKKAYAKLNCCKVKLFRLLCRRV